MTDLSATISQMTERVREAVPGAEKATRGLQRILFATNGSDEARNALQRTAQLSKQHNSKILAVQITDKDETRSKAEKILSNLSQQLLEACKEGHSQLHANVTKLPAHFDDEEYGRAVILQKIAGEHHADLITLGMHKKTSGSNILFGTMVDRLVRTTQTPVLLVRSTTVDPYRHILVGADLSNQMKSAFQRAHTISPQAEIHALHIRDEKKLEDMSEDNRTDEDQARREEILQTWHEVIGDAQPPVSLETQLSSGPVALTINSVAKQTKSDLIIIGAHRPTNKQTSHIGSTARALLGNPACDIMVLPAAS